MSRLLTAQPAVTTLVANLRGAGDPSRGVNPTKIRTGFTSQHIVELNAGLEGPGMRVLDPLTPGSHTHIGMLDWTTPGVPVASTGVITVANTDFTDKAYLHLGEQIVISGDDYSVTTGTTYLVENITNTPPDDTIVIWKTAGAGLGEGTIGVPAHLPIEPGTVILRWTSGTLSYTQTDDGAGGFTGNGNPAGSSINYTTGAITWDTTALPADTGSLMRITYDMVVTVDDIAFQLAAYIDLLPGFSAVALADVVTVTGPFGLDGNNTRFKTLYRGSVENFTLVPTNGFLSGGEPIIGPPTLI